MADVAMVIEVTFVATLGKNRKLNTPNKARISIIAVVCIMLST